VEILEKTKTLVDDGLKFFVKISATVTTDNIAKLAARLKDKNLPEEYRKLQEEYARLTQDIQSLKQALADPAHRDEREALLARIHAQGNAFLAAQKREAIWYDKLVSGGALADEAAIQLTRKHTEHDLIDDLFRWIVASGYQITVGEPSIETSTSNPQRASLTIPIAVSLTSEARTKLAAVAEQLGGDARTLQRSGSGGRCRQTALIALPIILSKDSDTQAYLARVAGSQALEIKGLSKDSAVLFQESYPVQPQRVQYPDRPLAGSAGRCSNHHIFQYRAKDGSGRWEPRWAPIVVNEYRTHPATLVFLLEDVDRMSLTWDLPIERVRSLQKCVPK